MEDRKSAEQKEKPIFRFLRFLFFELWSFQCYFCDVIRPPMSWVCMSVSGNKPVISVSYTRLIADVSPVWHPFSLIMMRPLQETNGLLHRSSNSASLQSLRRSGVKGQPHEGLASQMVPVSPSLDHSLVFPFHLLPSISSQASLPLLSCCRLKCIFNRGDTLYANDPRISFHIYQKNNNICICYSMN